MGVLPRRHMCRQLLIISICSAAFAENPAPMIKIVIPGHKWKGSLGDMKIPGYKRVCKWWIEPPIELHIWWEWVQNGVSLEWVENGCNMHAPPSSHELQHSALTEISKLILRGDLHKIHYNSLVSLLPWHESRWPDRLSQIRSPSSGLKSVGKKHIFTVLNCLSSSNFEFSINPKALNQVSKSQLNPIKSGNNIMRKICFLSLN